jgi:hypothetical protein
MLQVLDSDSSKIIEAVRSTGVVVTEAMRLYVDYIVSNMKAIGTWDLCNAVYGFVGGTADSHKFNWKDLRDVDAAFRLTYGGSQVHNSLGIANANADISNVIDTKIIPSINLTAGNTHLSVYSTPNLGTDGIIMGAIISGNQMSINTFGQVIVPNSTAIDVLAWSQPIANNLRFTIVNNMSNTLILYLNGIIPSFTTSSFGTSYPTNSLNLGGINGSGQRVTRSMGLVTTGLALTVQQIESQSHIARTSQAILNRA